MRLSNWRTRKGNLKTTKLLARITVIFAVVGVIGVFVTLVWLIIYLLSFVT